MSETDITLKKLTVIKRTLQSVRDKERERE